VRTVPATVATLALGTLPAGAGRQVGARLPGGGTVEVDIDATAATAGADAARRLVRYAAAVRDFRARPAGPWVATTRTLIAVRLRDPGHGRPRVRLAGELAAVRLLAGVGSLITGLLASDPDRQALAEAAAGYGGTLTVEGHNTFLTVTVPVSASQVWPVELGGAIGPDEYARTLTVRANHARSRSSAANRLLALEVVSHERFCDPAAVN